MKTLNECHPTARAHENTALWINNDQGFNDILNNAVEQAVYGDITKGQAIVEIIQRLPDLTPDGERWMFETIQDLVEEQYNEQLQYSENLFANGGDFVLCSSCNHVTNLTRVLVDHENVSPDRCPVCGGDIDYNNQSNK